MSKNIMIVDDEPHIRESVKMILEKNGYTTTLAVSGDDCLKKLEKGKPDLILMDIMMPGTPVKDVIKKIKGVKIIFVSVVRTSEAEKGLLKGASNVLGFVQKPFDIKDLLKKVNAAVGRKK